MAVAQVNTLQGPVDQPFGRIYYALGEIKAIDCLPQGQNKSWFTPKGSVSCGNNFMPLFGYAIQ